MGEGKCYLDEGGKRVGYEEMKFQERKHLGGPEIGDNKIHLRS